MRIQPHHITTMILVGVCLLFAGAAFATSGPEMPARILGSIAWSAAHPPGEVSVLVSFNGVTEDSAIEEIAREYGLRPHVLYMHAGDLYGTHRTSLEDAGIEILWEARENTSQMQEKARARLVDRAEHLLGGRTLDEFLRAEHVHEEVKKLAFRHEMDVQIAQASESGAPLVYAFEALMQEMDVPALRKHPTVSDVQIAVPMVVRAGVRPIVDAPEVPKQMAVGHHELRPENIYLELRTLIQEAPEVR